MNNNERVTGNYLARLDAENVVAKGLLGL